LDLCAGRFERCFAELAAAKLSFAGTGNLYGPVFTTTIETQALVARGHLQQAMDLARATYECATVEDGSGSLIRSQLGVYLAETLYEAGEYEQALKMSGDHAETMRNIGMIDGVVIAARVLARCRSRLGEFAAARRDIEITKEFGHRAGHRRIVAAMSIEEQLLEIRQFGTEAGTGLAAISIEDETWRQLEGWTIGSNNVETIDVARCRLWIHTGEAERALRALPPMIHQAQQCGRRRLALKFRVLLAEAYSVAGLEEKALRIARDAVEEGMPQGFVALFQEEGEPLTVLLRRVLCAGPPDHLARFLDILDAQPEARASSAVPAPTPLAPLSDRELQVLRCLAAGMSNRAIGEQLFISEPTVKFHLRNINSKLGASNRTHAVHLARANGLLRK
jgi:LuxR family maltose regulon positive regulatory protein